MKRQFARTSNVIRFVDSMSRLQERGEDLPGMALIFGEPGLGKTRTALWWALQHGGVFIRALKLMSGRWLLESIVAELGEAPAHRTSDLFRQCVEQLLERPRTLIIDEVDYLAYDARVLETLRDVHDCTGAPMVFLGMAQADKKLKRYGHLYDRFIEILRFQPLTRADIVDIAAQLCDVALTEDAVDLIHADVGRFRQIQKWLYRAEAVARANNLKEVSAANLNGRG
jgi:DNA transposition AAA+ family ATPase